MTNAQIVLMESIKLMEDGVIKGTGQFIEVENDNGEKKMLELPEAIHTFASWKARGRQVKKGEHAIAQIVIWKQGKGKKDEKTGEEENGRMFMKKAFFFTEAQTEAIK
jgi:hypothetical protein